MHLENIVKYIFIYYSGRQNTVLNTYNLYIPVYIFFLSFSHVTTDKFYIQPVDSGIDELLVIDRVSQEISLQGMKE